jgi:hypothetical protein
MPETVPQTLGQKFSSVLLPAYGLFDPMNKMASLSSKSLIHRMKLKLVLSAIKSSVKIYEASIVLANFFLMKLVLS